MTFEEYLKDKRKKAETESANDLYKKTIEHLLTDLHDESLSQKLERDGSETVSRTMARFASLLVLLGRKADDRARDNLKMQKTLERLTWALVILTAVLAGLTFALWVAAK